MNRLSIGLLIGLLTLTPPARAQAPSLPKVPAEDSSKKAEAAQKTAAKAEAAAKAAEAAKGAEKAASAQKASEKAAVAQDAASKAEAAQKSAAKAESAQKAAEKASAAQNAAEKAEVAQKAAAKAESAQKAAEKASVAQNAAEKAEVAQKAAAKAESAQKAAEKASVAQNAAEKAEVAQKAASKAESAQKAAEKASVAQNASEKAEVAQKAASKAESAQKAAEKATVAQNASEKAGVAQKAAEKASGAQASADKASAAAKSAEAASKAVQSISKIPEPVVPKTPTQPREPGTPKITTSAPPETAPRIQAAVEPPKPPANASLPPKSDTSKSAPKSNSSVAIREAVRNASSDNLDTANPGGPKPEVPANSSRNAATDREEQLRGAISQKDKKNPADQFKADRAEAKSPVDSRLNDDKTTKPKFDQGFGERPKVTEADADAIKNTGNPARPGNTSGPQGPLADSAKDTSPVKGAADQKGGLISEGWRQMRRAAETVGRDSSVEAKDLSRQIVTLSGDRIVLVGDGSATIHGKDGTVTKLPPGSVPYTPPKPPDAGGGADQPAEDTTPLKYDIVGTSTLAEQIRQSKIGKGGGVTDPTRTSSGNQGSTGEVVSGRPANPADDQLRNLAGQPGNPGTVNESGGNKGVDTSNLSRGAGGIRPADDSGMRQGIEQKAEDFLDRQPTGDRGLEGGREVTTAQPIKKPDLTLAQPIAEDKAALSKAIGPITRPATGELSTGGDSGTTTESGSGLITASESGSAKAPAESASDASKESNSKQASGSSKNAPTDSPSLGESKTTDSGKKPGFWQRLFGGESKSESKTDSEATGALSLPDLQRKNEEAAPKPTRVATRIPGENSNPSPDSSAPDSDQDAQEMAVVPSGNGEADFTDPATKAGELTDQFGGSISGPTPDPFAPENFGKPTRPREPGTIALPVSTSERQSRPSDGLIASEPRKGGANSTLTPAGLQTAKPRASATPKSDQNSGSAATPPGDGASDTLAEREAASGGTQVISDDGSVRQTSTTISDGTSNTLQEREGEALGDDSAPAPLPDGSVRQTSTTISDGTSNTLQEREGEALGDDSTSIPPTDGNSNTVIANEEPPVADAKPLPSPEKKRGFFESLFGESKKKTPAASEKASEAPPAASNLTTGNGTSDSTTSSGSVNVSSSTDSQASAKGADGTPADAKAEASPTFKAANRDSEKKGGDRELKPSSDSKKDSKNSGKEQTPAEVVQEAVKNRVRQELISAGVSPVAAEKLAGKISTGEQEASETTKLISSAAATLQLAGASQSQMDKALTEIAERRLTDASSGGTTDSIIGAEVVEAVTGRRLDPKLARPGEIARALLDAKAAVQLVGLDETKGEGKALIDQIFDEGLRGDKARDAIQKVIRPIVQEAEREQNGGGDSASSDAKAPAVDLPNQTDIGTGRGPAVVDAEVPAAPAPVAEAPAAKPKRDVSTAIDFSDIDPNSPTVSVVDSLVPGAPRPGSDQLPADKGTPPKGGEPKDSPPPADPDDKDKDKDPDGASPESSPTPPPKEEEDKPEGETPAPEDEDPPEDGTPNPMNERGGNSLELAARTGGRLGGEQAKAQARALDLILGGGGAGGPGNNPNSEGGSIILSPGEIAILSKTLSSRTVIKTVNGAVDPNPLEENSAAITERDLKELHLKGTGGAKGPTENAPAPAPQDPNSPLVGPGPIAPPQTGKTSIQSSAVKVPAADKIKVEVKQATQATGR